MKKMFLILGTLLSAISGVNAQIKEGSIIPYEGINYEITKMTTNDKIVDQSMVGNISMDAGSLNNYTISLATEDVIVRGRDIVWTPRSSYQNAVTIKGQSSLPNEQVNSAMIPDVAYVRNSSGYKQYSHYLKEYNTDETRQFWTLDELLNNEYGVTEVYYSGKPYTLQKIESMNGSDSFYFMAQVWYDEDFEEWIVDGAVQLVNKITVKNSSVQRLTTTDVYTVGSIQKGVDWGTTNTVTIGSTVESIETDAFAGSTVAKFIDASGNFKTSYDGSFLYDYSGQSLIAIGAEVESGTYDLLTTIKSIYNGATANISNVTLYSPNPSVEYDKENIEQNGNRVVIPAISYSAPEALGLANATISYLNNSPSAHQAYGITLDAGSVLTAETVAGFMEEVTKSEYAAGLCYIDMSKCAVKSVIGEIATDGLNPNCLVYLPASADASGRNVIVGGNCSSLELVRETGAPFYAPTKFVAGKARVSNLPIKEQYNILCFPFKMEGNVIVNDGKSAAITGLLRICRLNKVVSKTVTDKNGNDSTAYECTFVIGYIGGIESNTPYLINSYSDRGNDVNITSLTASDVTINPTANNEIAYSVNGVTFAGTYQSIKFNTDDYDFFAMASGDMRKAGSSASLKPFTGFMYTDKGSKPASARIRYEIEDPQDIDFDLTGVDDAQADNVEVVASENGLTISASSDAKVVVTSLTGVKVFDGVVNGTKSIEVNKGVYIVNGKKYFVK